MNRYYVPSATYPGVSYEVSLTDDRGFACECPGYAQKAVVAYVTGVRNTPDALCRHARIVAEAQDLPYRLPKFYWTSLSTGEIFPVTERPRSGDDEHILAYYCDGQPEIVQYANESMFPQQPAAPDRDRKGRIYDLLDTPAEYLNIALTGKPGPELTRREIKRRIEQAGANINPQGVTATTNVLVAGDEPSQRQIARAARLLTPVINYPSLLAILNGNPDQATDQDGRLLRPAPAPPDYDSVSRALAPLVSKHPQRRQLHAALQQQLLETYRVIAATESYGPPNPRLSLAQKTLTQVANMLERLANRAAENLPERPESGGKRELRQPRLLD